jgi:hypothetical protein
MSNMKTNTGLLALAVFALAGALTVACGGSDNSDGTPTGGSGGTSSGGTGSAGKSSSAGTTNSGAGTATNNGGTINNGGTTNGGRNTQGGFGPGVGGAPDLPDCPATAVEGEPCTPMSNGISACQVDDSTYCICQGQDDATWICPDLGDIGAGGAFGAGVSCPANAKNGDTCTGFGLCPTSQMCGCLGGSVLCQP